MEKENITKEVENENLTEEQVKEIIKNIINDPLNKQKDKLKSLEITMLLLEAVLMRSLNKEQKKLYREFRRKCKEYYALEKRIEKKVASVNR